MRKVVLAVGMSPPVHRWMTRYGLRIGAGRFVAGEELDDAVATVQRLNAAGLLATLDFLGESVRDRAEACAAAEESVRILEAIDAHRLKANLSLKLTQLGLGVDRALCLTLLTQVVERAAALGSFVRIDMESSAITQVTIDLFRTVYAQYPAHVGLVIQAYLYRSEQDVKELGASGANLRLVKGAYHEPPDVAFPAKADVDANFRTLTALHMEHGHYTAVATHDEDVIAFTREKVRELGLGTDQYEFQMLYGIRSDLQRALAEAGHRVRVYVPYGRDWYAYFVRRLAERPANLWFVLKNAIRG